MDEEMIRRWNYYVANDDLVYHLGDFTLKDNFVAKGLFLKLKGRISVLNGSHDKYWYESGRFMSMSNHEVRLLGATAELTLFSTNIQLHHYAQRVWWLSHYGSYHLYGHSHGRLPGIGRSMDVGVDCNDFRPISLEAVISKLRNERNPNQVKEN